ncbi:MAG: hypothetical protein ACRD6R_03400 [Candidatus Polarisedimenticolia bacterium]
MVTANLLTVELHLIAGLGAIALGGAALVRGARRVRSRLFAALCAAFAIWTLAFAAYKSETAPDVPWRLIFLLGSCLAAPIGLHFCLVLIGRVGARRAWVGMGYAVATALYASACVVAPRYESPHRHAWNYAAIVILGAILLTGLAAVFRHTRSLPPGRERSAFRMFLYGATIAVLGGLSDFVPRGGRDVLNIGPVAVLTFLVIVGALVVRHRFLDVDVFIVRASILAGTAAIAALVITIVARPTEGGYLPVFATALALTLLAAPTWKFVMDTGASRHHPVSRALMEISRNLPSAQRPADVWRILEVGLTTLQGRISITVYALDPAQVAYTPVHP